MHSNTHSSRSGKRSASRAAMKAGPQGEQKERRQAKRDERPSPPAPAYALPRYYVPGVSKETPDRPALPPTPAPLLPDARADAPRRPPSPIPTGFPLLPALAPGSQTPAQKIEPHRMSINEGRDHKAAHFLQPWRRRLCGRAVAGFRQLRESEGKFIPFCWYLMCFGCCRI